MPIKFSVTYSTSCFPPSAKQSSKPLAASTSTPPLYLTKKSRAWLTWMYSCHLKNISFYLITHSLPISLHSINLQFPHSTTYQSLPYCHLETAKSNFRKNVQAYSLTSTSSPDLLSTQPQMFCSISGTISSTGSRSPHCFDPKESWSLQHVDSATKEDSDGQTDLLVAQQLKSANHICPNRRGLS